MLGSPRVGEDNRDRQDGVSHEDHHHTDGQALEVKPAVVVGLHGITQQDGKQEHEPVPNHPPPRKPPATSEIAAQQLKPAHGVGMPASPLVHAVWSDQTVRPAPRWPSCGCRAGGRPKAARRAGLDHVRKVETRAAWQDRTVALRAPNSRSRDLRREVLHSRLPGHSLTATIPC
jgi:hypothetical protein